MRVLAVLLLWVWPAAAAPLQLYDTSRDQTPLAPLAPAPPCGGFAVACSTPAGAKPSAPVKKLPFEYGLAVSGMVGGGTHIGGFSGEAVSGWVKPDGVPMTLYFDVERFQPFGR